MGIYPTHIVDGQPVNVVAVATEPQDWIKNSVMLNGGTQDSTPTGWSRPRQPLHREIVRLGASRREDDLTRSYTEIIGKRLPRFLNHPSRCPSGGMQ